MKRKIWKKKVALGAMLVAMGVGVVGSLNITDGIKIGSATEGATITVESKTTPVELGADFTLSVDISNNPGFAGATFDVVYDSNVLIPQAKLFKLGSAISAAVAVYETNMSLTGNTSAMLSADDYNFTRNGQILTLNFILKENCTVSSTTVGLKLQGDVAKNFSNISGNAVPVSFVAGTVALNVDTSEREVTFYGSDLETAIGTTTVAFLDNLEEKTLPVVEAPSGKIFGGWYKSKPTNDGTKVTPGSILDVHEPVISDLSVYPVFVNSGNEVMLEENDGTISACSTFSAAIDGNSPVAKDTSIIRLVKDVSTDGEGSYLYDISSLTKLHVDLNGHTISGYLDTGNNPWDSYVFRIESQFKDMTFENTKVKGMMDINIFGSCNTIFGVPSGVSLGSAVVYNFANIHIAGSATFIFDSACNCTFNLDSVTCDNLFYNTMGWGDGSSTIVTNISCGSKFLDWATNKAKLRNVNYDNDKCGPLSCPDGYTHIVYDYEHYAKVKGYGSDADTLIDLGYVYAPEAGKLDVGTLNKFNPTRPSKMLEDGFTRRYYTFAGWATSPDATSAVDLATVTYEDTLYPYFTYVDVDARAAEYNGQKYMTIAEALKAAEGSTEQIVIKMIQDSSEFVKLTEKTPNVVIDLNGKTLSLPTTGYAFSFTDGDNDYGAINAASIFSFEHEPENKTAANLTIKDTSESNKGNIKIGKYEWNGYYFATDIAKMPSSIKINIEGGNFSYIIVGFPPIVPAFKSHHMTASQFEITGGTFMHNITSMVDTDKYDVDVNAGIYTVTEKHVHTWGDPVFTWADDGSSCSVRRTCTDSTCTEYIEGAANITSSVKTAPTCTSKGVTTYTAKITLGGDEYQDTKDIEDIAIDSTAHNIIHHDEVAPTCTTYGVKEYYSCTLCNKNFEDQAATQEITDLAAWKAEGGRIAMKNHISGETWYHDDAQHWHECTKCEGHIDVANHTFDQEVVDPLYLKSAADCENPAVYYKTCICGFASDTLTFTNGSALGHTVIEKEGKAPTCTEDGWNKYYECSVCHDYFSDSACINKITDLENWKTGEGKIAMEPHTSDETWHKDTTQHWHECTECKGHIDVANHTFDQEVVDPLYLKSAADCENPAVYYKTCICGAISDTLTFTNGNPLGHDLEKVNGQAADCDKPGWEDAWFCDECDIYFSDSEGNTKIGDATAYNKWKTKGQGVIPLLGHELEKVDGKAADCEHAGYLDAWFCEDCNKYFSDAAAANPIGNETEYNEWKTTGEGKIDALGHTTEEVAKVDSTCTTYGVEKYYTCTVCHKNFKDQAATQEITDLAAWKEGDGRIAMKAHTASKVNGQAETCCADGYKDAWYCSECEQYFSDEACSSLIGDQATYNTWKTSEAGKIAKHAHAGNKVNGQAATCTEAGYEEAWYCSECEQYFSDENFVQVIGNEATYNTWKTEGGRIAPLGHNEVHHAANEETCTVDGNIEYWYCEQCDKYFSNSACTQEIDPSTIVIPAHGHNEVYDPAVPATTVSTGLTEGSHCSICGEILNPQGTVPMIPKPISGEDIVEIVVEEGANEVEAQITPAVFDSEPGEENKKVVIEAGDIAEVEFNNDASKAISENADGEQIVINIERSTAEEKQSEIQAAGVKEATAVISLELATNEGPVFSKENADGQAVVSFEYELSNQGAKILVYYINGSEKALVPCEYKNGKIFFTVEHFSDYVISEHVTHEYTDGICYCGAVESNVKFYLEVESGNKVTLVVRDNYGATVRLPVDGRVDMSSVTIKAIMQNVASLGVEGIRTHEITINTGLSGTVDLTKFLSHAYDFEGATLSILIDKVPTNYNFSTIDGNLVISATTNTEKTREAWQSLTSHVSTSTQAEDDSYVIIANGSYIKIGTEFLRFEDGYVGDLKLDNFNDFTALEAAIREAIVLDTCEDQENIITVFIKKGTALAVGQSVVALDDDYMIQIALDYDALDEAGVFGIFTRLRACVGANAIIKGLVQEFNKVINAVDSAYNPVAVYMHEHELIHVERKEATCTEAGNIEYWYCEECYSYFSDAKGYNEILESETIIPATGHTLEEMGAKAPTCTEAGWKNAYFCDDCDTYFSDAEGKNTIGDQDAYITWRTEGQGVDPASGHSFDHHICDKCGCVDESTKFYLDVKSGNEVYLVVGDDYNATVRLPINGIVDMSSVTLKAIMQNVASLGVEGTRTYEITINTGLTGTVDLKEFLSNAYGFQGATIIANIDDNIVTYNFADIGLDLRINATTITTNARNAWQALTSHISTSTQTEDDSYVVIANGSYIKIGTEFLRFEDGYVGDLKLDNFNDFAALEEAIREAVTLDTCVDQDNKITLFVKAGTKLAVGQSIATLDDDYMAEITLDYDALNDAGVFGIFNRLRACVGGRAIIKQLVKEFNNVILAVDSTANPTAVYMHEHAFTHVERKEATCTEAGNIEYWYCEECGQYYSDAKGYIQIAEEDTIIPATGHTLEEIEGKAPTCTEDGWKKAYFCDDCDKYFSDAEGKNTIGDQDDYIAWRKDAGKEEHLGHDFVNHVCERCGCIDDATKFYFEVESGNKVYLVVGNDYGATVRLPLDGNVGMDSVTLTAIMQDVASLGVEGTRKYSITINTGLTGTVNLEEFLSHAYDFEGAQVTIDIDGNDCYYNFLAIDSNLRINTETDTESTRAAWQALTSHITTSTQAEDDSYVIIVNGSYIKIGTEFLRFEDGYVGDLKLDNFNDFAALEEAIREAIALYTCEDQEEKITVFVKAGTTLAVGNSIATLDDDYMMEITLGYDALDEAGIFGIFNRLRACVGAKAIIKGLVQEFNKVIYAVDLSDVTDISMHVHELEYVAKKEATCTEVGYEAHWYCAECDGYYLDAKGYNETTLADITIPIEPHNLVKQTGKPATCTEDGWKDAWLCSGCGDYYADAEGETLIGDAAAYETWKDEAGKIPMIAHDLTHVAAKDAKCLEAGNIEYWYCDECHQYFSDAQGQTVITQESTIIPALGHDKEHTAYKAATCTEVGNIEYWYCNRCEKYFSDEDCSVEIAYEDTIIPMIAHTLVKVPGQAATCTADGYKDAWKCSECNEYFTNEQGTISIGDADDYAAWILDSEGGKLAKHDHTLTIVNGQAAQCLVDGYKDAWHCSECNQYFSDENGAHVIGNEAAYNSWKVGDGKINKHVTSLTLVQGQAATCTADGYKDAYTCSECGKFYEDANAVTLIGNVTDYNEWATNGNGKIAKHAHTANKINGQAETCCADGYQDAWKCSECNQYFSDEACSSLIGGEEAYNNWKVGTGKIAKHPHAGNKVDGQAATCTEAGWKDAWKCSECNQYFSDSAYTALIGNEAAYNTWKTTGEGKINAKGHQGVVVAGKAETCCADGYKNAWRCSECGLYFSDSQCVNLIGNLDAYNTWKTTGAGRIVKHAHAGDKYNGKAATCTEAGYKDAWKCSECNQYFADMSYSSLIGNEAAYITWRTTGAGKIDAKGHKAVLVPGQAATCTEAGYKDAYKCLVCEKYFSDSACTALIGNETDYNNWITLGGGVIAKHAHTGVKVAGQAETCTTVGYKDAWKCSECGQYFSDSACSKLIGNQEAYETWKSVGGGMIPTHAHTATKVAGKEATCTEVGYRDAYKCSECNQYFSDSTCLTLIGGEVAYNTWKNIGGGKINELGHSLVYVEKIEATREHDGVKAHYECSRCGKLFVVVDGNYKEVTIEQLTYAYSAGCGGSVVATSAIISILSLAGAGLLLLKRRKED